MNWKDVLKMPIQNPKPAADARNRMNDESQFTEAFENHIDPVLTEAAENRQSTATIPIKTLGLYSTGYSVNSEEINELDNWLQSLYGDLGYKSIKVESATQNIVFDMSDNPPPVGEWGGN